MNQSKLHSALKTALQHCEGIWADNEKTELANNLLLDKIQKYNTEVMMALLNNHDIKSHFFAELSGALIFKQQDFQFFLSQSKISHSYTKYKNRIGLSDGSRFLKDSTDIVLDFPFKDCVLNGGQSSEEGEEVYFERNNDAQLSSAQLSSAQLSSAQLYQKKNRKRQEIFFNQILASDEIDRLFDFKALSHFSRYTQDGKQSVGILKRHADGTIAENLIIKGNNLIALHSLKTQFKGKVKLIYIDPPYNTGNDDFKYNDKFSHSSWLIFMKNRLEIAKELLSNDGIIFVQCDDNEQAYLKILIDEIFGRSNFINCFIPLMNPRGRQESAYPLAKSHEYILIYSKEEGEANFYNFGSTENNSENDTYRLLSLRKSGNASLKKDRPNMFYPIYYNKKTGKIYTNAENTIDEISILPIKKDGKEGRWRWKKSNVENNSGILECKLNSKGEYDIYVKDYLIKDGIKKGSKTNTFLIDKNIINDKANNHIEELFGNREIFSYPKSEYLLQRIIEISTRETDIVLDYHLGSGTTAAVAHKMKRQYIGIEQMDYIESLAVERLKKVIDGEQGGISKAVNWQGGGDFVYFELAAFNENAKALIKNAENFDRLQEVFDELCERYFLKYTLSVNEFIKIMQETEFQALSLDEQKQMMLEMLDLNQLYVNRSDMEDSQFADILSEEDKDLTEQFYGEK